MHEFHLFLLMGASVLAGDRRLLKLVLLFHELPGVDRAHVRHEREHIVNVDALIEIAAYDVTIVTRDISRFTEHDVEHGWRHLLRFECLAAL